jgi:hypothetical protein
MASDGTTDNELERGWKEVVVAYSRYYPSRGVTARSARSTGRMRPANKVSQFEISYDLYRLIRKFETGFLSQGQRPRHHNVGQNHCIEIGNTCSDNVAQFTWERQ